MNKNRCRNIILVILWGAIVSSCSGESSGDYVKQAQGSDRQQTNRSEELAGYGEHGAASVAQGGPRELPPNALHVTPVAIIDYIGFEKPMGAATLFLPHGWRAEGGVEWGNHRMCTNGYAMNWRASSPDGEMSIAMLPQHAWGTNNYGAGHPTPGCSNEPHQNVRDYISHLIMSMRQDARLLDYRSRADIQKEFAQFNQVRSIYMGELRQWVEAGEMLFAYNEGGREMRGVLIAVVLFSNSRTNVGMGDMISLTAFAMPGFLATAPSGKLNFAFMDALRTSFLMNPEWERRIGGHNAAMAKTAAEGARQRSEIMSKSNADIARIQRETWEAQQVSADKRAREFSEVIRGVETYDDPNAPGGTVELSHNYDQAWRLDDGSYVLTNDANFDPWRDLNIDGQRLGPTP